MTEHIETEAKTVSNIDVDDYWTTYDKALDAAATCRSVGCGDGFTYIEGDIVRGTSRL